MQYERGETGGLREAGRVLRGGWGEPYELRTGLAGAACHERGTAAAPCLAGPTVPGAASGCVCQYASCGHMAPGGAGPAAARSQAGHPFARLREQGKRDPAMALAQECYALRVLYSFMTRETAMKRCVWSYEREPEPGNGLRQACSNERCHKGGDHAIGVAANSLNRQQVVTPTAS
jgi:hypothetical protein